MVERSGTHRPRFFRMSHPGTTYVLFHLAGTIVMGMSRNGSRDIVHREVRFRFYVGLQMLVPV